MNTGSHRRHRCAISRLGLSAAIAALIAVGPAGCESHQNQASLSQENPASELRQQSTTELRTRLDLLHRRYAEITREVEQKSGLQMGLAIRDDRALLGEIYREAHEIERELSRRGESSGLTEQARLIR